MALICKTTVQGNGAQRSRRCLQELLRLLHPLVLQPLIRCHAGRLTKRSREVPDRKVTGASEGVQREAPANVGIEELFGLTLLPRCETASPLPRQCRDVAVSTGNVNRERQCNVINEEFGGFLRSCSEGWPHSQQQIAGDRIPNGLTNRMMKFLDVPRDVSVVAHGHKRLVGQVEIDGVEWVSQVSGKVHPQVEYCDSAGIEVLWCYRLAICVQIEIGARVHLERDQERVFVHWVGNATLRRSQLSSRNARPVPRAARVVRTGASGNPTAMATGFCVDAGLEELGIGLSH
jgi:hypothetical protein